MAKLKRYELFLLNDVTVSSAVVRVLFFKLDTPSLNPGDVYENVIEKDSNVRKRGRVGPFFEIILTALTTGKDKCFDLKHKRTILGRSSGRRYGPQRPDAADDGVHVWTQLDGRLLARSRSEAGHDRYERGLGSPLGNDVFLL